MKKKIVSASVVLYKTPFDEVFSVIQDFFGEANAGKIFLVDNSPAISDELVSLCSGEPRIEYIFLNENVGYGKAHNIAMRAAVHSGSQFHMILNPDVRFNSMIISGLIQKMEDDSLLAHIMPRICYPDGSAQFLCKLLPSPYDLFMRRFLPFSRLRNKLSFAYELRSYDYQSELKNVPSLSGCFMFLRLDYVRDIGYFDENIFMYMEDVDLTRRLLERYSNLYCPAFVVFHGYQKGSYKNFNLLKYHVQSAIYYFSKWGWVSDPVRRKVNQSFKKNNIKNLLGRTPLPASD